MANVQGGIHGKIIEVEQEPGLRDGQQVTVTLTPAAPGEAAEDALEALKRAAGSWSDDVAGLDRFLEWNRQQRKVKRRQIEG